MWGLLKRLSSDCWGNHEWISRANAHGLWLECRHCGLESNGLELAPVRYRRTQDGAPEAHRLGGVAPALRGARAGATAITTALRFTARRTAPDPAGVGPARAWDATTASSAVATTDAERRWLQAWRALTPEERAVAERMVAGLTRAPRDEVPAQGREDRPSRGRRVG
jgi:hypothetical protein